MCMSHLTYAQEQTADADFIEQMNSSTFGASRFTRAAFLLRERCAHDLALSLVAWNGEKIIGSVRQTPIIIGKLPALLLGPLVVHESHKNIGIGRELMRRAVLLAKTGGHKLILLVGDESYYGRFGFKPHKPPIILPAPADPQRILVCELEAGACEQAKGRVRARNSVHLDFF